MLHLNALTIVVQGHNILREVPSYSHVISSFKYLQCAVFLQGNNPHFTAEKVKFHYMISNEPKYITVK